MSLGYEDVKEFFELFINDYIPYKDSDIYNSIIEFLTQYYTEHSYQSIPEEYVDLFENQTLKSSVYDTVLLSLGFTKSVLDKLSTNDKLTLINVFSDFNRYKGSIKSFQTISDNFESNFNIYELMITKDTVTGEWVFSPYPIYIHANLQDSIITEPFTYEQIINSTDYFYINKEYLEGLEANLSVTFPIKSNLVLLDHNYITEISEAQDLIGYIIYKEFYYDNLIIFFSDGEYSLEFNKLLSVWYYIMMHYYTLNETIGKSFIVDSLEFNIIFNIFSPGFTYTYEDIPIILDEFNSISTRSDVLDFQDKWLIPLSNYSYPSDLTQDTFKSLMESNIPNDLKTYLDNRIANSSIDARYEANLILTELYNSLITFSLSVDDTDRGEYFNIFVSRLPLITKRVEDTVGYYLLDFVKPYHVEFIGRTIEFLIAHNGFNSLFQDHYNRFEIEMNAVSVIEASSNLALYINMKKFDPFTIAKLIRLFIKTIINNDYMINDLLKSLINLEQASVNVISESFYIKKLEKQINNDFMILDSFTYYLKTIIEEDLLISDPAIMKIELEKISMAIMSGFINTQVINTIYNSFHIIDDLSSTLTSDISDNVTQTHEITLIQDGVVV
ncbi:MAG: hypothetical protein DRG78_12505 [Epsilonproteobacteria bacterium]|nr:MAG: hypothetical protein DRG78_12505 [Campylobacterota bacterium]